jgi:hypothetical protein
MSALPPKADMRIELAYVCYGPKTDQQLYSITSLATSRKRSCPLYPRKRTFAPQQLTSNESRREYVMSSMGNGGQDRGFPVSQSSCGSASDTHSVRKKMITAGHQLCLPDASTATPAIKAPTIQIPMTRRLGGSNIVWLELSRTTEHAGHVPLDKVHGHRV